MCRQLMFAYSRHGHVAIYENMKSYSAGEHWVDLRSLTLESLAFVCMIVCGALRLSLWAGLVVAALYVFGSLAHCVGIVLIM